MKFERRRFNFFAGTIAFISIGLNNYAFINNHVNSVWSDAFRNKYLGIIRKRRCTGERLANVATMLTNTTLSNKEIAAACDFSDSFHLMHTFRRRYGLTMSQYRAVKTLEKKVK